MVYDKQDVKPKWVLSKSVEVTVDDTHTCTHTHAHTHTYTHTITAAIMGFFYSSPSRPSLWVTGERTEVSWLLSEAAATCHQGHSQWVITLDPGPQLQALKIHVLWYLPLPRGPRGGLVARGPGFGLPQQSRTRAAVSSTGRGIDLGRMEGGGA